MVNPSGILQKPVSSPTEKQLASWLKEADKATGLLEFSIAGLVFMVDAFCLCVRQATSGWLVREVSLSSSCYVKRMLGCDLPLRRSRYRVDVVLVVPRYDRERGACSLLRRHLLDVEGHPRQMPLGRNERGLCFSLVFFSRLKHERGKTTVEFLRRQVPTVCGGQD
jgi:hypothetical protein